VRRRWVLDTGGRYRAGVRAAPGSAGSAGGISNAERGAASSSGLSRTRVVCQNFGASSRYRSLGQYGKMRKISSRYPNAQVVIFDKDRSARAATLAVGGAYYEPGHERAPVAFQPLGRIDDRAERLPSIRRHRAPPVSRNHSATRTPGYVAEPARLRQPVRELSVGRRGPR
jgi:hypothetical protein